MDHSSQTINAINVGSSQDQTSSFLQCLLCYGAKSFICAHFSYQILAETFRVSIYQVWVLNISWKRGMQRTSMNEQSMVPRYSLLLSHPSDAIYHSAHCDFGSLPFQILPTWIRKRKSNHWTFPAQGDLFLCLLLFPCTPARETQ